MAFFSTGNLKPKIRDFETACRSAKVQISERVMKAADRHTKAPDKGHKEEESFLFCQLDRIDIPQILNIEELSNPMPWSSRLFAGEFSNRCSTVFGLREHSRNSFGSAERSRLLGFLVQQVIETDVYILNFAVDPRYRRRKLGSCLLGAVLQKAKVEGALWATLEVRAGNKAAIALYERFGFSQVGVRRNYYSDNREDALLLSVSLERDNDLPRAELVQNVQDSHQTAAL